MDDRALLDEHALSRARLVGGVVQGTDWRERRDRGTFRRLLGGFVIAVLACAVIAAASFVSDQLTQQRREQREREQRINGGRSYGERVDVPDPVAAMRLPESPAGHRTTL